MGSLNAQEPVFPDDFVGQWVGELEIYTKSSNPQKLEMEIQISKSNHLDTLYYTLKYINAEVVDQRDYLIIKDSQNSSIVKIDEQNGIILDMEQFGNKWISVFRVDNSMIHFHLTIFEHQMIVEVFSISQIDTRITGGNDDIPTIAIMKNSVYQRALLMKI